MKGLACSYELTVEELQCAGSNSDQSSRRLLEQKTKLEVEVKGLKLELQRRDSEDIRIKAANAKLAAESSMVSPLFQLVVESKS